MTVPAHDPPVRVAVLGVGNVGGALVAALLHDGEGIANRSGVRLELVGVAVGDPSKPRPGLPTELVADARRLVEDPGVDVVVELIGGIEPAGAFVRAALKAGKPVVTANKALLAAHGAELAGLASGAGVDLLYEAAVAGAIPLIRPLRESLAGERVQLVMGIVNGTTNYILTTMAEEGLAYEDALAEAQRLGLAERDPTADVDGHDAAAKAAILASLAFRCDVVDGDVAREGVSGLRAIDVANALRLGYVVKLLAVAERSPAVDGDTDDAGVPEVSVRVHPALVPATHPLASVRGAFNAVFVVGDGSGSSCSTARGRGACPRRRPCSGTSSTPPTTCAPTPPPGWCPGAGPGSGRPTSTVGLVPQHRRPRPPRRARRRRHRVRRPRRVDPLHGADGTGRRGPADLPHPRRPARATSGPRSTGSAPSTWSSTSAACCGSSAATAAR